MTTSRRLSEQVKGIRRNKSGKMIPKSVTSGKDKGDSCKADWRKRYYMSHPHAYRNGSEEYSRYHQMAIDLNKGTFLT